MGARPDRSPGDSERCCSRLLRRRLAFVFLACACLAIMAMVGVATDGASLPGSSDAAAMTTTGSPAWRSGGSGSGSGRTAGADAFRSSKRRIPRGPNPIHNRRAGKTTTAPRRRD